MTGWVVSQNYIAISIGYIRREVVRMTAYEIITIFIEILFLLISFGGFLLTLLTFLAKRN
ncbi:hypothetical protein FACS1894111_10970 [Clostridia bacterium]|nr:hypothetical protein FACS1894111_10970 [Clostridia bacterium]